MHGLKPVTDTEVDAIVEAMRRLLPGLTGGETTVGVIAHATALLGGPLVWRIERPPAEGSAALPQRPKQM